MGLNFIFTNLYLCSNCFETFLQVLKEATRLYAASWVRDIGPELRPNEYKKKSELEDDPDRAKGSNGETEPSTLEDLGKLFFIQKLY